MPRANIFDGGDGLNTAVSVGSPIKQRQQAPSPLEPTTTPTENRSTRRSITPNSRHKIAANYSYEWTDGVTRSRWPDGATAEVAQPGSIDCKLHVHAQGFSVE
jgi:hypothetical protein